MSVYTFTRTTQWCFEVLQVIAQNELDARRMIKDICLDVGGWTYNLDSEFKIIYDGNPYIVFTRYIDNPCYEG